jgi:hypothetical protein
VWHASPESALENTRDFTRPVEVELGVADAARRLANGVVFELIAPKKPDGRITIGRSSECDIQILSDSISRTHIELPSPRP